MRALYKWMAEPRTPCPCCGSGRVQPFLRASALLTGVLGHCLVCGYEQPARYVKADDAATRGMGESVNR